MSKFVIKFKKYDDEFVIQYPIKDFNIVFGYKPIQPGGRKKQERIERTNLKTQNVNSVKNKNLKMCSRKCAPQTT